MCSLPELDFYGTIKLVNYIRSMVSSGKADIGVPTKADIADDKYLQPVLANDALLFSLGDLPEENNATIEREAIVNLIENDENGRQSSKRVQELEEELARVQTQFSDYRLTVEKTLDARWSDQDSKLLSSSAIKSGSSPTTSNELEEKKRDDDSHYFSSYSFNGTSLWTLLVLR